MTVVRYRGDAAQVAQVDTVQITGMDGTPALTTYTLTVGERTVEVVGDTDEETTAVALAAAWNAATVAEFTGVTANAFSGTTPVDTITLTADVAGIPFTVVSSVSGGSGTIGAVTSVTASAGRYHADTASNWDPTGLPGDGDDVVFDNLAVSCLFGLDTSAWPGGPPLWASVTIKGSYTGYIGLPEFSASGDYEYRDDFLIFSLAASDSAYVAIGEGDGSGSGRLKLSLANRTNDARIDVYLTGSRADPDVPALLIGTGTNSSTTTLNVSKGDVGVGVLFGGSAVIDVLNVGFVSTQATDAAVEIGDNVTLTTINQTGGTIDTLSSFTTATLAAGTLTVSGAATATTINVRGGTCYYNSNGTLGTVNVTNGAVLDFRRDQRDVTVTNMNLYEGATVYDTGQRVTLTNGFDTIQCGLADLTLDFGDHLTWTPSSI